MKHNGRGGSAGPAAAMMKNSVFPVRKQIHPVGIDYANPNNVYFLTLCTYGKGAHFSESAVVKVIVDEIDFRVSCAREVAVFAYCVMPDHLHMLMKLKEGYGKTLQNWVAAFKRYTARNISASCEIRPVWQKDFYEHILRSDEELSEVAESIVNNPVRKRLVDRWEAYPFSKIDFNDF